MRCSGAVLLAQDSKWPGWRNEKPFELLGYTTRNSLCASRCTEAPKNITAINGAMLVRRLGRLKLPTKVWAGVWVGMGENELMYSPFRPRM